MTKEPPLPLHCIGWSPGSTGIVVSTIQKLKNINILKSYLLLFWPKWDVISSLDTTCALIRKDFSGIESGQHQEDLIKRLDLHYSTADNRKLVFLQPMVNALQNVRDAIQEVPLQHPPSKTRCIELKDILLELDREATETLTRTPSRLMNCFNLLISVNMFDSGSPCGWQTGISL